MVILYNDDLGSFYALYMFNILCHIFLLEHNCIIDSSLLLFQNSDIYDVALRRI